MKVDYTTPHTYIVREIFMLEWTAALAQRLTTKEAK